MIIQIRATSGAGKSTLARAVMSFYPHVRPHYREGRKQPLYTVHTYPKSGIPRLAVIGSYNNPCGGADGITDGFVYILNLVRELHSEGYNVLFEGMLISGDTKHTLALFQEIPDHLAVTLSTPLDVCLRQIAQRRAAKGNTKPVNPANTTSKHRATLLSHKQLTEAGVHTLLADYPTALTAIKEALQCV